MEIKEQAESLRKQGMTYKQISSTLDGAVSVNWLRRNISKVEKGVFVDPMMKELIEMSSRPEGCSNYEAQKIIYQHATEHKDYEAVKRIKTKAKKIERKCMFYPAWLDPHLPLESNRYMLFLADELYENIQHAADRYVEAFPNTSRYSALNEIVGLAHKDYLPEPLGTRLERNTNKVEELLWRQDSVYADWPSAKIELSDVSDKPYVKDIDSIPEEDLDDIWAKDIPY